MSTRTYQDAVSHLNSLQSNAATLEAVRAAGTTHMNTLAIPEMIEYLGRIGYTPEDLNALNVIHVTGTKGKGSTSAFASSILQQTRPDWKIGLYTSPHLCAVRERIRVNGIPLSEELFAKYFFDVWDKLEANRARKLEITSLMPAYFKYVTLMAFHAFLDLKVDATILEVGVGGTFDSTNIVPKPITTGVTALGIDHVAVLGKTLPEIAWQKGGIYKNGVPAFTVRQPTDAHEVLRGRATELKASSFTTTAEIPSLDSVKLGLAGEHQKSNAALAVHLAASFLNLRLSTEPLNSSKSISLDDLPESFIKGLELAKWPGRCQVVRDPLRTELDWFLDGAHTIESLHSCISWFASPGVALTPSSTPLRILIFNCTNGRSGSTFLTSIHTCLTSQLALHQPDISANGFFTHVIFCTNVTYSDGHFKGDLNSVAHPTELVTQQQLAEAWKQVIPDFPETNIHVLPSIEHAIKLVQSLEDGNKNGETQVLVSGSLHLVGGVIEVARLSDVAL